jgi:hypothetical protein
MPDKKWYASPVVGGIVGIFAGGLTILVIESLGHALLGTADPGVPSSITTPMFLSVLIAWIAGSFVAGSVATAWARARSVGPGVIAAASCWPLLPDHLHHASPNLARPLGSPSDAAAFALELRLAQGLLRWA